MYTNQNGSQNKKRSKRYTPVRNVGEIKRAIIILLLVFLLGFAVGGVICVGIYRATAPAGDGFGTVGVVDPGSISSPTGASDILICIDPGHGFLDVGALSDLTEFTEYELNMRFSRRLAYDLSQLGFSVVLTHDGITIPYGYDYNNDNTFDELIFINGESRSERRDYAMSLDPDMFISVHCNTFVANESVGGMRIYFDSGNTRASAVCDMLTEAMSIVENTYIPVSPSRKEPCVGDEIYAVTRRWDNVPALLTELGFMTNETDVEYLENEEWIEAVSRAYTDAIATYFNIKR